MSQNRRLSGKHRILRYKIKTHVFLPHFRGAWTLLRTFAMVWAMILHETCGAFVWDLEPEKKPWSSGANLHRSWGVQWKPMGAPALNRDFESTAYCLHGAPCLIKPFLRSSSPILTKVVELSSGIWSLKTTWSSRVNLHGFLELNP